MTEIKRLWVDEPSNDKQSKLYYGELSILNPKAPIEEPNCACCQMRQSCMTKLKAKLLFLCIYTNVLFFLQNLMAKALYDNVPESPEELAFRKGDILTVIEQNTGGLEGWWLCSLHGRQGIAPGNRLKLLIGPMFEAQSPVASAAAPPAAAAQSSPQSYQQKAGAQGLYQVPPSLHSPQQQSQQSIYQVPPGQDIYQVPPRSTLAADNTLSKVRNCICCCNIMTMFGQSVDRDESVEQKNHKHLSNNWLFTAKRGKTFETAPDMVGVCCKEMLKHLYIVGPNAHEFD